MNTRWANILCAISIAILAAYAAFSYAGLPNPLPTHWDAAGNVNDTMDKPYGVAALLSVPVLSWLLFKIIPVISPRGFRTDEFADVVNVLMVVVVIFGSVIGLFALLAAQGGAINISKAVVGCVGVLLILIGNYMGKMRKNFFIGIRTPWTLASDEVWAKTHRLGGWCFVVAGILFGGTAFTNIDPTWTTAIVIVAALIPVVYSYFAYRSIEGFAPDPVVEDEDVNSVG